MTALEKGTPPSAVLLRREYAARLRVTDGGTALDGSSLAELQREAVRVQRQALLELRARSVIGDDAFHVIEEEIDLLELSADGRVHPEPA
jgi:CPA1 family monovalent cation:H+ antiporter